MFRNFSSRLLFLNIGHFTDHLLMLIFAKAAFSAGLAFGLAEDGAYAEMIPYGIPSLVLFGACAPIAAHFADRWHRNGMIVVFFIGIGFSAILTSFSENPVEMGLGLALIGVFAAIYHPVGIAMVIEGGGNVGWRLGLNGVWGNMGVAGAPLVTGFILADYDWQLAFIIPGCASILFGIGYLGLILRGNGQSSVAALSKKAEVSFATGWQRALISLAMVTAAGGFVFGAMTFLVPRLFEVRMLGISEDIAIMGALAAVVYAIAAFAQLLVGRTIDQRAVKPVLLFVAAGQPLFLGLMVMQQDYALFAVTLLAMGFVFGQIPINDVLIGRFARSEWRSRAFAIRSFITFSVYATTIPLIAWLHSTWGFSALFLVLCICAIFILAAVVMLPKIEGVFKGVVQ